MDGHHPRLYNGYWYLNKWEEDDFTFRALVKTISFIRNSWSGIVRTEFTYDTWYYNDDDGEWQFC